MMCTPYDARAIFLDPYMVCSRHMSAPTVLKDTGLRLIINLPASNRMRDFGVVSQESGIFY